MKQLIKFFKYYLPLIIWAGIIFWFSSLPTVETTDVFWQDFLLKKSAHFIEYLVFALLLFRSLKNTSGLSKTKLLWITLLLSLIYAVSDELHQSFVPGREPRIRDVVIDTLGAASVLFVITKLTNRLPRKIVYLAGRIELI
jgi:hypothetical protein